MKKTWSKSLLFLMLAFVLVLAACGNNGGNAGGNGGNGGNGGDAGNGGNGGNAGGAEELTMMWWGPEERHKATLEAIDIYEEQTGISFQTEQLSWDGFWQKLPTLAASKSMTDVLQMDAAYINDYVARGTLADLSDIDLTGVVDDAVIENLKINGKLYGLPISQNAQGLAYNKAELEANGIELPKEGWTWEEYFEWGRTAKEKLPEGKYAIGDGASAWDWINWYQTGNGADPLFTPDGLEFNLDKDLFMEFHQTFADMREQGIVPPPEKTLSFLENDPTADPMASGTVMTRGATTGSVSALETMMPGQVAVINLPVGEEGGGWAQSTIFLSVSADTPNMEESKEFVKWFITDMEAGKALGMTRGIPISPEVYAELEPNMTTGDKLGKELYDIAVPHALPFYAIAAGFTEWVDTYESTMEGVMFGQTSIEDAYEQMNELGNRIAEQNAAKQ